MGNTCEVASQSHRKRSGAELKQRNKSASAAILLFNKGHSYRQSKVVESEKGAVRVKLAVYFQCNWFQDGIFNINRFLTENCIFPNTLSVRLMVMQ